MAYERELLIWANIVTELYVSMPEVTVKKVEDAARMYIKATTEPVNLWTHFRCASCGVPCKWGQEYTITHGVQHDDHRIVRQLCVDCYTTERSKGART